MAAGSSPNERRSFFVDRNPEIIHKDSFNTEPHEHEADQKTQQYRLIKANLWSDEVINSKLSRRGWVLQRRGDFCHLELCISG